MKKAIVILLVSILIVPGCKFFKEKFSKKEKKDEYAVNLEKKVEEGEKKHQAELEKLKKQSEAEIERLKLQLDEAKTKSQRYKVVVGGFKVPGNAERFAGRLRNQGFEPEIVRSHNGFDLVSIYSYGSLREALGKMRDVRHNLDDEAWVYIQ